MTKRKSKDTGRSQIFASVWWSVELPPGWKGSPDSRCVTFRSNPPLGALQVSSARKDRAITDQDLKEFMNEATTSETEIKINFGPFSGFSVQYTKEGLFWQEWWLRSGQVMVYATYNVVQNVKQSELEDVEKILRSLAIR